MNYHVYTPDTGTTELPRIHRGQPYYNLATVELHLLDLRPAVTRVDRRPWLVVLWLRVLASPFADHLRTVGRSAFWPLLAAAAFLVLYVVLAETRGMFLTWDGFASIPTGGAR